MVAKKKSKKKAATKKKRKTSSTGKKPAARKKKASTAKKKSGTRRKSSDLPRTKLTRKELEQFRRDLLEKRQSIVGSMNGMEIEAIKDYQYSASRDRSNPNMDLADIGSESYETEFTLGLLESERKLLDEIDEALDRIDDKTYGICLATKKQIRKARLKAIPWCKYTLEHAQKMEGTTRP